MSNGLATLEREVHPLAILQQAVERGTDAGQLEKLMDLAERWEKNEGAKAFGVAVARFQSLCPQIPKSRKAVGEGKFSGYQYAAYEDVMKIAGPHLDSCGLALSFSTDTAENGIKVTCRVRHGIHFEDHSLTVPVPGMRVNDTQRYGAALSYAKRYALCAALNIVVADEDNDAQGLGERVTEEQAASLREWLESTSASVPKFCEYFGISTVAEMPAARYQEALAMLKRKQK